MDESKKRWAEELHNMLWAYLTTAHSTKEETPFRLAYGIEAVIPVELMEPFRRVKIDENDQALREELDLVNEIRMRACLRQASLKRRIAIRHDTKVIHREFYVGSLVLKRNHKESHEGKLTAKWEGRYRVYAKTGIGVTILKIYKGNNLLDPGMLKR